MASRRLLDTMGLPPGARSTDAWPDVDANVLKGEKKDAFQKRRKAVKLYMNTDRPITEIVLATSISKSEVVRFVKRCLKPGNGGGPIGFYALLDRVHLKKYSRRNLENGGGYAGLFDRLLAQYADLPKWIENQAFGIRTAGEGVAERNKASIDLHTAFTTKLRGLGVKENEYPFNSESQGYEALRRYVKRLEKDNFEKAAKRNYLDEGRHVTGSPKVRPGQRIYHPYEHTMADTHAVDTAFVVGVPMPDGLYKPVPIHRFGVMAIIDKASRCSLGWQPMLNRDARSEDLLAAVRNAIVPWRPRQLTIPDLEYPAGSGFPSGVVDGCAWRVWDLLSYDNAQAHLAANSQQALADELKCGLNDGESGLPESRAILERLFRTLESRIGHRVVSTTGSNPDDYRRRNPEKSAIKYDIVLDDLLQLMDVGFATYNITEHSAIGKIAPLDYLRMAMERGDLCRRIPEADRKDFSLHKVYYVKTVRGNLKRAVRPYVFIEGARYRNQVLAGAGQLIGKQMTCVVNSEDMRFADLFLESGKPIGRAVAQGSWGLVKHTLRQRKMVNSGPMRHLSVEHGVDPIAALNRELARRALSSTRAARAYAQSLLDSAVMNPGSITLDDDVTIKRRSEPRQPEPVSAESLESWVEVGDTVLH